MNEPKVSIFFDKRGIAAESLSVKWCVFHEGKQRLFTTGIILPQKDVEFLKNNRFELSGRVRDERLRNLWNKIYGASYIDETTDEERPGYLYRGKVAVNKIKEYFTFELFAKVVNGDYSPEQKTNYSTDLLQALRDRAQRFADQGDISSGNISKNAARSLERFVIYKKITTEKAAKLPMQIVTKTFLRDYEKWMLKFGKAPKAKGKPETPASITTVSINLRNVRTAFNEAIDAGILDRDLYPFSKRGYIIPAAKNTKKALGQDAISAIFHFECKSESQEMARDLWVFSYLCNGMNFMDICHLRRSSIKLGGAHLEFIREKTKDSNRQDVKTVRVPLMPESLQIIDRWGNNDQSPSAFLFPFLDDGMTLDRQMRTVKQVIWKTNKNLAKISEALGLDIKLRTYEARHSFATTLLRSGAPMAFIAGAMSHASVTTTEKYFGSFEAEQTQVYMSALIPRKQESQD
ncbi:tyrosine-type recombinase/integrase [Dyadobacter fermentans]|uniref:Integrase family protein n=1 Tax=Dyadobacter fermentans (strain ATCC 700827 / DSM 18053 / CIP 107007 / KCTC 52180 / NS114) TaxID=471854 RepID=C6VVJ2_DYAFD|nr:site-specific integrase [Dyadobacter fermentans]ACT96722.1 integrase family protein [Dyadobacter fermentans DSM 18053]